MFLITPAEGTRDMRIQIAIAEVDASHQENGHLSSFRAALMLQLVSRTIFMRVLIPEGRRLRPAGTRILQSGLLLHTS